MSLRTAALVCALALALPAAASAQDEPYTDWNPAYAGFPSDVKRDPTADCDAGADVCIARTIDEMWRRFHTVVPVCEHNAVFSLTYLRVTEDIQRGLAEGFYPDKAWLNRLDAIFARAYFLSYSNWQAGRRALVPPAWRVTYDAAAGRRVQGAGNLLMSMSAHVNRDFAFALYHSGLVWPDGRSHKPEHDSGNARLRAMYRPMLTELAQRFDASIDDTDVPGTEADDEGLFSLLVSWREHAWRQAERLAAAGSDAERRAVAADIERLAEAGARELYSQWAYKPGDGPAARDALCALEGGQDPAWGGGSVSARAGAARPAIGRRGLRLSRRGTVTVPLFCPAATAECAGVVDVSRRGRRLGRSAFSLPAGARRGVTVSLRRRVRGSVRVVARSRVPFGTGFVTRSSRARLR